MDPGALHRALIVRTESAIFCSWEALTQKVHPPYLLAMEEFLQQPKIDKDIHVNSNSVVASIWLACLKSDARLWIEIVTNYHRHLKVISQPFSCYNFSVVSFQVV